MNRFYQWVYDWRSKEYFFVIDISRKSNKDDYFCWSILQPKMELSQDWVIFRETNWENDFRPENYEPTLEEQRYMLSTLMEIDDE